MHEETSSTSPKKPSSKWKNNKVGVFWTKKKDDGKTYLSGSFEVEGPNGVVQKIPVCIFKNEFSDGKTPHFQAFKFD
tara:strand:+ start:195 stop:425 length:231 start_codon:yes stop_codon:yes gene_type:complete